LEIKKKATLAVLEQSEGFNFGVLWQFWQFLAILFVRSI